MFGMVGVNVNLAEILCVYDFRGGDLLLQFDIIYQRYLMIPSDMTAGIWRG